MSIRRANWNRWCLLAAMSAVVVICAPSASAQISSNNPSQILQQYRSFRTTWITNIWPYANTLFALLAVIEFAWSAAVMALEKTDLQSWTSALIRKIMWLGAFYALLLYGRQWIPAIIDSFSQLGGSAAGINGNQGLSPSDVFTQGLNIAAALMDAASSSAFFTNPGTCLAVMLAAALVVIAFIAVTIQYIVAVVESYLVVSAGVIFLGFGGSRWTTPYVERYIGLGVSDWREDHDPLHADRRRDESFGRVAQRGRGYRHLAESEHDWLRCDGGRADLHDALLASAEAVCSRARRFSGTFGWRSRVNGNNRHCWCRHRCVARRRCHCCCGGRCCGAVRRCWREWRRRLVGERQAAVAGVGGGMGAAGSAGGGNVPPPSSPSPGPSSGGRPRQPNPPSSGSAGAPAPSISQASASNGAGAFHPSSNGSSNSGTSRSTSVQESSAPRSVLASVGGDSLAGSGFEAERPAAGFVAHSIPVPTRSAGSAVRIADFSSVESREPAHGSALVQRTPALVLDRVPYRTSNRFLLRRIQSAERRVLRSGTGSPQPHAAPKRSSPVPPVA